jgi:hypothetical protein
VADLPGAPAGALSRRGVMVAGLGLVGGLAAAGCSVDTPASRPDASPKPGPLTPDVAVATEALAAVRAAAAAVRATTTHYPATRPDLAGLAALHQAHVRALINAVPSRASTSSTPPAYAVPRRRDVALTRLTGTEQRLHDTLGALALRAQSGDFARLLASMGTAVTLHLTELAR